MTSKFSTKREDLCERGIDVSLIEPQIWKKRERFGTLENAQHLETTN